MTTSHMAADRRSHGMGHGRGAGPWVGGLVGSGSRQSALSVAASSFRA